jgi:hypothetical protein
LAKIYNRQVGTVVYAALSAAITERIIQRKNEKKEKIELNKQHFLGTINVDERALLKHIYGDKFSDDELGPGYFTCFSLIFTRPLGTWYESIENPKKLWEVAPALRTDWKRDMSRGVSREISLNFKLLVTNLILDPIRGTCFARVPIVHDGRCVEVVH